ncbi:MAG: TIGR00296 family protein, partial [Thermoplasmatales archaeon]
MLSLEQGIKAVTFARRIIESFVENKKTPLSDFGELFNEKQGVFVTIHAFPNLDLRGCIGIPLPIMSLKNAIIEAAKSATKDPRFFPITKNELENIIIEVTILTKPELINVNNPKEYLNKIKIGRDGLIVEKDFYKGLLLPQVPVEQGWDKKEFLSNTCMKAGLLP